MSYAIPGQRSRPALDAALADLERQAATGICGVCGKEDRLRVQYGGSAFLVDGKMTPWMCQDCAKAWQADHSDGAAG